MLQTCRLKALNIHVSDECRCMGLPCDDTNTYSMLFLSSSEYAQIINDYSEERIHIHLHLISH